MKILIPFLAALALGSFVPGSELPGQLDDESIAAVAHAGRVEQPAVPPRELSANDSEVVRLAEAGIEGAVLLAFVEAARTPFDLSADDVIYLNDIGIASAIVSAMLHQDTVLRDQNPAAGVAVSATAPSVPPTNTSGSTPPPFYVTTDASADRADSSRRSAVPRRIAERSGATDLEWPFAEAGGSAPFRAATRAEGFRAQRRRETRAMT